jgi:hypothetical protein
MTSRARNPGLLGLILAGAGAVSSFSGCNPFVAAGAATAYLLHNNEQNKRLADAQRESAQIQADAMRDAARVQAGNGNSNSGGVGGSQGSQTERDIARYGNTVMYMTSAGGIEHTLFAFKSMNDLNGNGRIELSEIYGIGKSFSVNDSVIINSALANVIIMCNVEEQDTKFDYFLVNSADGKMLDEVREKRDWMTCRQYPPDFFKPGNYRAVMSSNKQGVFNSLDFTVTDK